MIHRPASPVRAGLAAAALALGLAALSGAAFAQSQADLNDAANNRQDWLYATHDYTGARYVDSGLITPRNAGALQPLCLFQLGVTDTFQSNGIVHDGTLYTSTPTMVAAMDATNCTPRWRYTHEAQREGGIASQRGLAIKDGMLVRGTVDGRLVALQAATGEVLWDVNVVREGTEDSINMAPLIYEDKVIVGPAGTYSGWLGAFSLKDGSQVWNFNTMPLPGEEGRDSWGSEDKLASGKIGGGSVWTVMSLDQPNGLLYVPVGNANPAFYGGDRPGDNLYTNTLLVLDVNTGERKWHYQMAPHDVHNWDTSQAGPLFTLPIDGTPRNLVAATGKSGVLQIVDRDSHEVLFKVPVTTQRNAGAPLTREGAYMCPGYLGGVQWNGASFSRQTNLLYVPSIDWCSVFFEKPETPRGGGFEMDPLDKAAGWLTAVDPTSGTVRWRYHAHAPMIAGVTSTAGGVVFTASLDGEFLALDARSGDKLYGFRTGGGMMGGILTYEIAGRQYVAAMTGSESSLWGSHGSPAVMLFGLKD